MLVRQVGTHLMHACLGLLLPLLQEVGVVLPLLLQLSVHHLELLAGCTHLLLRRLMDGTSQIECLERGGSLLQLPVDCCLALPLRAAVALQRSAVVPAVICMTTSASLLLCVLIPRLLVVQCVLTMRTMLMMRHGVRQRKERQRGSLARCLELTREVCHTRTLLFPAHLQAVELRAHCCKLALKCANLCLIYLVRVSRQTSLLLRAWLQRLCSWLRDLYIYI